MIRKIRNSLTVRICLLMSALLLLSSGITYAAVAKFLPEFYSRQLDADLEETSAQLADVLKEYDSVEEAFSTLQLFVAGTHMSVAVLDQRGNMVWPETQTVSYERIEENTAENTAAAEKEDDVISPAAEETGTSGSAGEIPENSREAVEEAADEETVAWGTVQLYGYDTWAAEMAGFAGKDASAIKALNLKFGEDSYVMLAAGDMQPVSQAEEILRQIFPYILGVAAVIAFLFALLSSLYLTAPVVRLSRTARKMAALDFTDQYRGRRRDEIGELGRSLNEMAGNLSGTLENLSLANKKLKSDIELERELERKRIAFFSAASHELKTPVTILKGHISGMLRGVGAYRDRDRYLLRAQETTEKMEVLVGELLTVSRMESRPFEMRREDVAEILRQQAADLTELMEEKGLVLQAEIPEHLYAAVNVGMMEKVFVNLLMNAIRYSPEKADCEIRILLETDDAGFVCCSLENTGVHIPEEALPHLFDAFYRVESSRSRRTGGSGLGLYIVRMALEQHGAQYGAENTPDGVRFFFRLKNSTENT